MKHTPEKVLIDFDRYTELIEKESLFYGKLETYIKARYINGGFCDVLETSVYSNDKAVEKLNEAMMAQQETIRNLRKEKSEIIEELDRLKKLSWYHFLFHK